MSVEPKIDVRQRLASKNVAADKPIVPIFELTQEHLDVTRMPGREFLNPLCKCKTDMTSDGAFHANIAHVMYDPRANPEVKTPFPVSQHKLLLELASARPKIHFNSTEVTVGIVTCGGLCPGLNDVIRGITLTAINSYRVKRVIGFRYGYWGLSAAGRSSAVELTSESVRTIHRHGGTILGSSRGGQKATEMVDTLVQLGVNVLFTVGGDGTQKGAHYVHKEIMRRGLDIAVFGVPKTIDNDLSFSHRTFGYETAVEQAAVAIRAAHAEASSHAYGVGIVKLMGRDSGFIAAQATVASAQASICLVPERKVSKEVFLALLERRFETAAHCVIVVAEGFGQDWGEATGKKDASGNTKLIDIGEIMKNIVNEYFKKNKERFPQGTVKYIDPSYMIRACPPNASDAAFCGSLSTLAVHEAMSGATDCIIALRYNSFIVVPIKAATAIRRELEMKSMLWRQVREITVDLNSDVKDVRRQELRRELDCLSVKREQIIKNLAKL